MPGTVLLYRYIIEEARIILNILRYVLLLWVVFLCSSCAAISHLDEALVLKEYSDDKDAQAAFVAESDRRFDELRSFIAKGDPFDEYRSRKEFIARFGEPVLVQTVILPDGAKEERLLYRYATRYFDGPKVYVFFDSSGQLTRVEHDKRQL